MSEKWTGPVSEAEMSKSKRRKCRGIRHRWKFSDCWPAEMFFRKGDRVNINAYARKHGLSRIRNSRIGTVIAVSKHVHVVWDGDTAAEIYNYHADLLNHRKSGSEIDTKATKSNDINGLHAEGFPI
jgi:hypothetical protein